MGGGGTREGNQRRGAISVCAPFTDSAAAPGVASMRGITVTRLSVMSQSAWC